MVALIRVSLDKPKPKQRIRQMEKEYWMAYGVKRQWDIDDVISEFDGNLNLTLKDLARKSGYTISELKEILNPKS